MPEMIEITLPDGSKKPLEKGKSAYDLALGIGPRLAEAALAAKIDGVLTDLTRPILAGAKVEIVTASSPEGLEVLRHSASHLMAAALKKMIPEAKVTIGPAVEEGFYYDFDLPRPLLEGELAVLEKMMAELVAAKLPFVRTVMKAGDAIAMFEKMGESYKAEIIRDLKAPEISLYQVGDFLDLCRGPHVPSSDKVKAFRILYTAGAYWRGDERNKMLTRVYGTAFGSPKELEAHLARLEEAKKRDHRKLGRELGIYIIDEDVGPGLPLWLPDGGVLIDELEKLAKETEFQAGYLRVRTPHITKGKLYETSGHLELYKESMYPPMKVDNADYYLKPMNCPHHHKIFAAQQHSYRDLPVRLAEYGTCYRFEQSGELFGLMRVRSMQMNDAHIYCSLEQFEEEFLAVCNMYLGYFKIFGIQEYRMRFSTHSKEGLGVKYVNEPELWLQTEDRVRSALKNGNVPFVEVANEAAFYGPKIDVQVKSVIGKEFTLATNQVDFAVPSRFGLTYKDAQNRDATPLCIHRAPLGTHERFIGFLLEHYAGSFPLWLAPRQVSVLTITNRQDAYAREVVKRLRVLGVRADADLSGEKINAKVRNAQLAKTAYMLVVGDKEAQAGSVAVRHRSKGDQGAVALEVFIQQINQEISARV